VRSLPWLLRPVAESLPTTHAFAAGRSFLAHRGLAWRQIGIASGETVVMGLLAVAFLTAMLGLFRRRGYITRYS
jgi:ABC-2 type transport system permease protein